MKKRDLKKKISEAYRAETPDLRSKILASCAGEAQEPKTAPVTQVRYQTENRPDLNLAFKRVAAVAICLMLFISGLSVGLFIPDESGTVTPAAESFVYLDVNPSIELQMDGDNKIVECIPANEDAQAILADMQLVGVDMNTAIRAVISSMYVNGYLTEDSNSILISVDSKDNAKTDELLTSITDKVNDVFANSGLECSIIAQRVSVDEELKQRAQENGVSVGKMHFVDKMMEGLDGYSEDDAGELAGMSVKDLNIIYSTRPDKGSERDPFADDVTSGKIGGFVDKDEALSSLLEQMDVNLDEIEHYEIHTSIDRSSGSPQVVYTMTVKLKDNDTEYEFGVDCKDGEVVKNDDRLPEKNDDADAAPQNENGSQNGNELPSNDNSQSGNEPQNGNDTQSVNTPQVGSDDLSEGGPAVVEPQNGEQQNEYLPTNNEQSDGEPNASGEMPRSNVGETPNQP